MHMTGEEEKGRGRNEERVGEREGKRERQNENKNQFNSTLHWNRND